jgi:hypothetical protein
MSHEATNWAMRQRGVPPAAKVVLWHLCDRWHHENGCIASIEALAHDCDMEPGAVRAALDALTAAGLVSVEAVPCVGGGSPRARYSFAFDRTRGDWSAEAPDFDPAPAGEPWGRGSGQRLLDAAARAAARVRSCQPHEATEAPPDGRHPGNGRHTA